MTAIFAWIRARNGTRSPVHAVVLFSDIKIREEIIYKRELSPEEHGDSLDTLVARYPAPDVVVD